MSGTNFLGSIDTMVPNPLQLEHAPDGELNEKLCGSRSSYDKSHVAQYLPVSYTHLTLPTNREV